MESLVSLATLLLLLPFPDLILGDATDRKMVRMFFRRTCDHPCLFNEAPVCDSSGQTWTNVCFFENAKCKAERMGFDLRLAHQGRCRGDKLAEENEIEQRSRSLINVDETCNRPCTFDVDPTCDHQGRRYINRCYFGVAECYARASGMTMKEAECPFSAVTPQAPLASTRQASSSSSKRVQASPQSSSTSSKAAEAYGNNPCSTTCPSKYEPVCDNKGRRYSNACLFTVAQCYSAQDGKFINRAPCRKRTPAHARSRIQPRRFQINRKIGLLEVGKADSCFRPCGDGYSPVCDNLGTTHNNLCSFLISQCVERKVSGIWLSVRDYAACDNPFRSRNSIRNRPNDSPIALPLISSDRQLPVKERECFVSSLKSFDVSKKCARAKDENCKINRPVCGSDGCTYANQCVLEVRACSGHKVATVCERHCRYCKRAHLFRDEPILVLH